MASEVEDEAAAADGAPLLGNGAAEVRRRVGQRAVALALIGSCFRFFIPFFPLYFLVLDFILFKFLGVQRDQAKAILSKQAVKIATKAEEHERFIFKVISLLPSIPLPNLPFFSLVLL
jgi:hypothetical protein